MNAILLVVTGISLALAGIMSVAFWRMKREERRRSDARVEMLASALYDDDVDPSKAVARLLETLHAHPWRRQILGTVVGVCAAAAIAGLAAVPARGMRHKDVAAPARTSSAPLELLSLEQERDGERLVVRGIVRNPVDGVERDGLSAVVLLLDHDGDLVSSGRASLPAATLGPGATAPFVVNVTNASGGDRFRLSFRTDARVEPHVDRRTS